MVTKILVSLDGSKNAERVLKYLRWLSPPECTELILVSVLAPGYYSYGLMNYSSVELLTSVESANLKYLDEQCAQLRRAGYSATIQVCSGDPAGQILEIAKARQVEMIAMTTHGRSGFARWALGSVAERVIHNATVPIFLIPDRCEVPMQFPERILVPLDGSKFAEEALSMAAVLAKGMNNQLHLLNAFPETNGLGLYVETQQELDFAVEAWREEMGAYLSRLAQGFRGDGINVETRMVLGDPAAVIDNVSVRDSIGLVVMSTHGRSGLERWVYGSVANKVLRMVDCPLVLVRPSKEEPEALSEGLDS